MADIYRSPEGKAAVERLYRNVLEGWPVPYRQVFLQTCERETSVIVSGDSRSPAVVLFHGSGTNATSWIRDIAGWSQHYCVYAVDMIGETGLSAPSRPPLTSDRYAAWLDDVWHQLGLATAHVVGISLGGWLALDYAVRRPDKVTSLALVSPAGIGQQNHLTLLKVGLLNMFGPWGLRKSLALISGREVPERLMGTMTTVFTHFRPRMARIPIRTDEELAALRMPVLAILGGRDSMLRSCETRDRLKRLVTHARILYLEDEGHLLPPQTQVIEEFLGDSSNPFSRPTTHIVPHVTAAVD